MGISLRTLLLRFGVVILAVATATILRMLLRPLLGDGLPFLLFIPVMIVCTWHGGLGSGLAATTIGLLVAHYVVTRGKPVGGVPPNVYALYTTYALVGILVCMIVEAMSRARARADRAVRALRESEARATKIVAACPVGIVVAEEGGRIVEVNDAFESILGYSREEALAGQVDSSEFTAPEHRPLDETGRRGGGLPTFEKEVIRKDGRRVPVLASTASLGGQSRMEIEFLLDLSDRKRAEIASHEAREAAESANRAKDRFLAVLSHELRTPLTPVLLTVSGLEGEADLPEPVREDMRMVRRNVEMLGRLIDDLLDVTRIAQGKVDLKIESVNIHELAREAATVCGVDIAAKDQSLMLDLDATRRWVRGDPARLRQVLWNLFKNAAKFTPERGAIRVRSEDVGRDRVAISVSDNGVGIAPEVLPRIFDAFEQGGQETTREFGGLGLGLAISDALVQAHGGTLSARSEGRGKGATFVIELEAAETPSGIERARHDDGTRLRGRALRILLVDDHDDTVRAVARWLSRAGHEVTAARSLASAVEAASARSFELLISDLGLPDGSGLDLMRQLYPLPGIALSGYGTEADLQASRDAGFATHLIKPIDPTTLAQAISQVVSSGAD